MTQPGYGHLRTSRADRERAADVLKAAFAEGRLDQDEFASRLGHAQSARTYAELAELTADLPVGPLGTLPSAVFTVALPADGPARPPAAPVPAAAVRSAGRGHLRQLPTAALWLGMATWIYPLTPFTLIPAVILGLVSVVRAGPTDERSIGLGVAAVLLAFFGAFSHFAV